jgi:hypothetical protein
MSNPFRGSDVAADMLMAEDIEDCIVFVRERLRESKLIGRPRSVEGRCVLKRSGDMDHLLCTAC